MTTIKAPQVGSRLQTGSCAVNGGGRRADLRGQSYDVQALFDEAICLFQAGRLSEAEKIFRCILEIQAQHFDALHLLGVVLSAQGKHTEGLRLLEKALQ